MWPLTNDEILAEVDRADAGAIVVGREWKKRPDLVVDLVARYPGRDIEYGISVARAP
jgi:hypothetical protein